ncbi:hypothetical protein [Deinococcus multiflagellatus]|uniref:Uncharacterized protein n=1 Tax=Deinococcus multiflagellatus TaxID=1656887 RepID=A0ABW1ZQF1_9DEIO|nr:hypothetical protein [Deinococcus multiflagellatus]MBZ9715427.1 hypothetical protein [Deinococcus multiflagellatus]
MNRKHQGLFKGEGLFLIDLFGDLDEAQEGKKETEKEGEKGAPVLLQKGEQALQMRVSGESHPSG